MDIKGFDDRDQEKLVPEFVSVDMSEEEKKYAVEVACAARGTPPTL